MAKRAVNFDKMAVAELVKLRDQIETALSGKIVVEQKELQARMTALAALQGSRSNGGGGGAAKKGNRLGRPAKAKDHPLKGRKAAAQYRGPDGETCAGRGLTPKWLTALEKKGKKRDSFLIEG